MINLRTTGYWITTGLFCLAMGVGGIMNLSHAEFQREAMASLGYPEYLMTILGAAKVLGVIALLLPRLPLLKEWAYAGFAFDLVGASVSHGFSGHAAKEIIIPWVLLVVAALSYGLRPSDRSIVRFQFLNPVENSQT